MQIFSLVTLMFTSYIIIAQTSEWDGDFNGSLVGVATTISGQANSHQWKASVDAGGYLFNLQGDIEGTFCEGTMTDIQNQESAPFSVSLSGEHLTLTINDINPSSGLKEKMDFVFTKNRNEAQSNTNPSQSGSTNPSARDSQHDPSLVGNWRHTESYVSGEFSFATDWQMQINPDGSFIYSEGRTAGGGPDASMDSGDGKVERGNWKSEKRVMWISDGSGWQAYAEYYRENNYLMFTFNNGKKQVWEKI
ncbi:MAG: hypothetical protein ABIQ02_15195 [Saprospiraceae bacterium]